LFEADFKINKIGRFLLKGEWLNLSGIEWMLYRILMVPDDIRKLPEVRYDKLKIWKKGC